MYPASPPIFIFLSHTERQLNRNHTFDPMGNMVSNSDGPRHADEGVPKHRYRTSNQPTPERLDSSLSRDAPNAGKQVGLQGTDDLDARAEELNASLDAFSHEREARTRVLEEELQQATAYIKELEARSHRNLRNGEAVIRSLQEQLAAAEDRNRRLASILASKQDSALNSMAADNGYTPMEDQVVRDELAKLGEKIRNWARKHSLSSLEDCAGITPSDKDLIVKELRGYTYQESWEMLIEKIPFSSAKVPVLLVQALLTKRIFEALFAHPFFAFRKVEGRETLPKPDEMMAIYRSLVQVNESEGHIWRSQTLRGLCRSAGNSKPSFLQERIEVMSKDFATDFDSSLAGVLLRHPEMDAAAASRARELQQLYSCAAQLALSLWTQRPLIICRSQGDAPGAPVFDVSDPVMRAHRLHQLDEDDHKLDGKEIVLFLQPAVLAFGSENAEHYDQYKVWASAVVVVGKR
ncbi:hypothetical protein BDV11DRAFT_198112 [Aspergillus similis]